MDVPAGCRRILPVAVLVVPFGLAFGVAAGEHGLSPWEATVMSAAVFSGAAQFAALDLMGPDGSLVSVIVVSFALSARHIVMGAVLSPSMRPLPWAKKVMVLTVLSDPNFAAFETVRSSGRADLGIVLGGGLVLWLVWWTSTAIGAGGRAMVAEGTIGAGVVMVCFFAATLAVQVRAAPRMIMPVILAGWIAILTKDVLPAGGNVVLAGLAGGLAEMMRHAD